MSKLTPCGYNDTYTLVKGIITITGVGIDVAARNADVRNKQVTFKNCVPFTDCVSKIDNIHDNKPCKRS